MWRYMKYFVDIYYLIIATPTRILKAPSIYLMSDLSSHVREICPAVAPGIAGLHLYIIENVILYLIDHDLVD